VAAHAARPFDMILMDCQMPELDGYGATAAIRKLPAPACQTIIVALTAHAAESGRRSCLSAGMDDFLSKPVMLYELAKVLHRWLGGRNGAQALDSMAQSAV
jgi:CheY-like chemotaxis protein